MESTETKSSPRDVFLYLLLVIVTTMSAVNLGTLLFQYVNLYIPDLAAPQCYGNSCQAAVRWSLASLIVVFPLLAWAWQLLQRDVAADPARREARARKWLLYLLLFVAGAVLIGDLVALVYNWLQGDLTVQFLLKILIVFYVAGTIFSYFLHALNPDHYGYARHVGRIAVVVAVSAIAAGLVTAGSPFRARLERLDSQRISALERIQNQIVNVYWISKGRLPATLDDLRDSITGFVPPVDPGTKAAYEYQPTGSHAFTLCASFNTIQRGSGIGLPFDGDWDHDEGRVCFVRTIDPQIYLPKAQLRQ